MIPSLFNNIHFIIYVAHFYVCIDHKISLGAAEINAVTWHIQGLFQPDMDKLSAGDKDEDLQGEVTELLIAVFSVFLKAASWLVEKARRPITGVWDRSKVNSIVRPGNSFLVKTSISVNDGWGAEAWVSQWYWWWDDIGGATSVEHLVTTSFNIFKASL